MLDTIFNLLGGSVLGVIGGCVNAWIAHKQRQSDQAHEISMVREERETRRVEAEMGLRVTEEEFSGKAFNLSQQAGNKTALSSTNLQAMLNGKIVLRFFGGIVGFLLGLADVARSAVRPGITIYLAVVCTNMLQDFIRQTGGVGIETRQEIAQYAIKSEFQLLNTCVSWWFGYRMTSKLMGGQQVSGMDAGELREMLIRIDERVLAIQKDIQAINKQRKCSTHGEKIKTLERMVWGTASAVLVLAVKAAYEVFK